MTLLRKNGRSETPQCGFHEEARAFVRGKGMVYAPGGKKKACRKHGVSLQAEQLKDELLSLLKSINFSESQRKGLKLVLFTCLTYFRTIRFFFMRVVSNCFRHLFGRMADFCLKIGLIGFKRGSFSEVNRK
ncbi:hypothetical protein BN982_01286 [Halobacillus karajensis]|uniref:Uncharacterized protein n=1 Tax=Halobacillus karajensis TaxID=195088 RepID=A0A059NWL0_9BACI|nr:hypothetical protein BN982_01286 [Halobacillus karajensis]CDQ22921.1 hypothetical protein BN983_01140 [Halobacillus karajensis]CDQ26403.1 hypothetical protein BN981_00620 [Halobacillus karajensis]